MPDHHAILVLFLYILADLENKVRHLWWPIFLQPNSILCLPTQETSAPPRGVSHHLNSVVKPLKLCKLNTYMSLYD